MDKISFNSKKVDKKTCETFLSRVKDYLEKRKIYAGESLHGFCGGFAYGTYTLPECSIEVGARLTKNGYTNREEVEPFLNITKYSEKAKKIEQELEELWKACLG